MFKMAREGDANAIREIMESSFPLDPNITQQEGSTAMFWAAQEGHLGVAKVLVEFKADVNHANDRGLTPLICAAYGGKLETVKWLIGQCHADACVRSREGHTALSLAMRVSESTHTHTHTRVFIHTIDVTNE